MNIELLLAALWISSMCVTFLISEKERSEWHLPIGRYYGPMRSFLVFLTAGILLAPLIAGVMIHLGNKDSKARKS